MRQDGGTRYDGKRLSCLGAFFPGFMREGGNDSVAARLKDKKDKKDEKDKSD